MEKNMKKWKDSLELEKRYWLSDSFIDSLPKKLSKRSGEADKFVRIIEDLGYKKKETLSILQIGSAGIGLINELDFGVLYAIDPLKEFYNDNFNHLLSQKVIFKEGVGEKLEFDTNFFDWAICTKTLSHVRSTELVLNEVLRILKVNGKGYISVPIYHTILFIILKLLSLLKLRTFKDYNMYTRSSFIRILKKSGFSIVKTECSSIRDKRRKNIKSRKGILNIMFPKETMLVIVEKRKA